MCWREARLGVGRGEGVSKAEEFMLRPAVWDECGEKPLSGPTANVWGEEGRALERQLQERPEEF